MSRSFKAYSKLFASFQNRSTEEKRLKSVASEIRAQPLFLAGVPVNELSKLARNHRYEMMILGTRGRLGVKRLFLGSVAEEIVRQAEIPVCIIGPEAQKQETLPPQTKLNIVLATDLAKGSRRAEAFAIKFAKKTGASITLVHCPYQGQDPMISLALNTPEGAKAVSELFTDLNKSSRNLLLKKQKVIEKAGIECKMFLDTKSVFAFRAILNEIKRENANLVIAGTHGRTLLSQAFFGSTVRQTVLKSPVPVVVVKSREIITRKEYCYESCHGRRTYDQVSSHSGGQNHGPRGILLDGRAQDSTPSGDGRRKSHRNRH
jgi:nucleotide-binding universal stress UspA family protein